MSIPTAALSQHVAIVGKTGSGKTHTTKVLIEQHVAAGTRVCILDPIKSDHWGLTSSASGKSPGLPFCILGGPKAHAPLPASSGVVIGGMVASGELPLSIIDMADMEPREQSEWYIDFATTIMRQMQGVLVLVMEEADVFAPKEKFGSDRENMRVYWSSRIARAGRSKGIRLMLSCQRTQKIHNDLLGSCETLIAHRLTTPADRKPVIEWLSVNTDKAATKKIEDSLSGLANGEAWVCYPEGNFMERVKFPRIETYDNSQTPTNDSRAAEVVTTSIDIEALKGKLSEAVAEIEANDPARLKARIAELDARPLAPDFDDVVAFEELLTLRRAMTNWQTYATAMKEVVRSYERILDTIAQTAKLRPSQTGQPESSTPPREPEPSVAPSRSYASSTEPTANGDLSMSGTSIKRVRAGNARLPHTADERDRLNPAGGGHRAAPDGALRRTHLRCLEAFLWYSKRLGINQPSNEQLCFKLGYSPTASTLSAILSPLRRGGFVSGQSITAKGASLVSVPPLGTREAFHTEIRKFLDSSSRRMFDLALAAHPRELTGAEICKQFGWSEQSSTLSVALSGLRRAGLVELRSHRLTPTVFPNGLR